MTDSRQWLEGHRDHLGIVLAGTLIFWYLGKVLNKRFLRTYKNSHDATIAAYRAVGLVHHAIQVPLAAIVLSKRYFWEDRAHAHDQLSFAMLCISTAYFLNDTIHALQHYSVQGLEYVLHGIGCTAVFAAALLSSPPVFHFHAAGFLMWEVSSFFVHFRWFIYKNMPQAKKLSLANGVAILVTFFFIRIVWGFYLSYLTLRYDLWKISPGPILIGCIYSCNLVLNALNVYWYVLILKKTVETLSGKDSMGKRD